jgi:hypothetical protein
MQLAAGQERHKGGVHLAAIVVPDEEPVLATQRLTAKRIFGMVVVDGKAAVGEELAVVDRAVS